MYSKNEGITSSVLGGEKRSAHVKPPTTGNLVMNFMHTASGLHTGSDRESASGAVDGRSALHVPGHARYFKGGSCNFY